MRRLGRIGRDGQAFPLLRSRPTVSASCRLRRGLQFQPQAEDPQRSHPLICKERASRPERFTLNPLHRFQQGKPDQLGRTLRCADILAPSLKQPSVAVISKRFAKSSKCMEQDRRRLPALDLRAMVSWYGERQSRTRRNSSRRITAPTFPHAPTAVLPRRVEISALRRP